MGSPNPSPCLILSLPRYLPVPTLEVPSHVANSSSHTPQQEVVQEVRIEPPPKPLQSTSRIPLLILTGIPQRAHAIMSNPAWVTHLLRIAYRIVKLEWISCKSNTSKPDRRERCSQELKVSCPQKLHPSVPTYPQQDWNRPFPSFIGNRSAQFVQMFKPEFRRNTEVNNLPFPQWQQLRCMQYAKGVARHCNYWWLKFQREKIHTDPKQNTSFTSVGMLHAHTEWNSLNWKSIPSGNIFDMLHDHILFAKPGNSSWQCPLDCLTSQATEDVSVWDHQLSKECFEYMAVHANETCSDQLKYTPLVVLFAWISSNRTWTLQSRSLYVKQNANKCFNPNM